jgi:cytochrome c oxidase subunit 3
VTLPLLLLVALMALVVGWLFRQTLDVKPWIAQHPIPSLHGDRSLPLSPVRVGLGVFLAVATSLFALLVSAYFMRRMGARDWAAPAVPSLLWLNTGTLVLSSVAVHRTRAAARRGQSAAVKSGLLVGGALTLAFLVGQLVVWRQLVAAGHFVAANPANAFFYLLTAVHAVHLLGGLWVWGRTAVRTWRGAATTVVRTSVDLCTVYWDYLLLVWLVLFGLLLST